MTDLQIFLNFLLAMGLGAIIGAERERFSGRKMSFGGLRTHIIISLIGAISVYLSSLFFYWFIIPIFLSVVLIVSMGYYASLKSTNYKAIGITSEITGILTFFIGVLAFGKSPLFAVVLAITITIMLYLKDKMHSFVKSLSKDEIYSTLIFCVVTFIILPFLPNQTFGPLDVLNPYKIWLMVVFISGLGYIGYILIKILGSKKGLGLTGLLGGLVSSTAVTMSMATSSKKFNKTNIVNMFVFATLIANAVMFVRVIVEVYVVNRSILGKLLIPMIVMGIVALIGAGFFWFTRTKNGKSTETEVAHASPFTLGPAIKFGLLFGLVLFAVKAAELYFGSTGIYLASIVSGFVDVDAITLTMANIAGDTVSEKVAVTAITLAVMSNTIIKFIYASMFGSKDYRKKLGIVFGLVVIAGLLSIWLI